MALKAKGTASLAAPIELHRKIVLGVRKEKTKDLGWKLQCLEQNTRWKLQDKSDDSLLTFTLTETESLSYATLTVRELGGTP